jgi:hypothetical protein
MPTSRQCELSFDGLALQLVAAAKPAWHNDFNIGVEVLRVSGRLDICM